MTPQTSAQTLTEPFAKLWDRSSDLCDLEHASSTRYCGQSSASSAHSSTSPSFSSAPSSPFALSELVCLAPTATGPATTGPASASSAAAAFPRGSLWHAHYCTRERCLSPCLSPTACTPHPQHGHLAPCPLRAARRRGGGEGGGMREGSGRLPRKQRCLATHVTQCNRSPYSSVANS